MEKKKFPNKMQTVQREFEKKIENNNGETNIYNIKHIYKQCKINFIPL